MDVIQLSALDHYFAEYISRTEGSWRDGLWIAAALVSAVSCRGNVCLDLGRSVDYSVLPLHSESGALQLPPVEAWQELLARCTTVGRPGDYTPLVLDASGRLYLHRSWEYERRVVEGILARSTRLPVDMNHLETALDCYFPSRSEENDLQREAARSALSRRFTVISGGPGTGKTTTVARILALLVELAEGTPPAILLAAPTGKAAMRLMQSISHSIAQLSLPDPVRAALPLDVSTIHRLLGVIPGRSEFRHNRDNQLTCDVLIVDEASMIDLPLMARMLEALHADTRVILLGDSDQLASVEAGAVLSDICAGSGNGAQADGDHPAIIHLTKSYRFNDQSGIGRLSRLINTGDSAGALELLSSGLYSDVCWRSLPSDNDFAEMFSVAAGEGFSAYARAMTSVAALEELDRFRILTPHREGLHGVAMLNRLAESAVLPFRHDSSSGLPLLPVMVTGNNYDLGLYNGDTGVVVREKVAEEQRVYFQGAGSVPRNFPMLRLPPCETAFVLTVHKSQGSEFERVLLILPDKISDVLSRELLYTAVTRARKRIEIWGNENVFCRAVERCIERHSGLADRLWKEGLS